MEASEQSRQVVASAKAVTAAARAIREQSALLLGEIQRLRASRRIPVAPPGDVPAERVIAERANHDHGP